MKYFTESPVPHPPPRAAPRPQRRQFLKYAGCLTAAGTGLLAPTRTAAASSAEPQRFDNRLAVLVDLNLCVGCRLCEYSCKQANQIDPGPLEDYDDLTVCERGRRPEPDSFTVVNAVHPPQSDRAVYTKLNCMHCNHPACVSACIVGALVKQPSGAVTYDAWKCIGCRYCMVACPFQLPAYSYEDVLTPQVRKCQFCFHRTRAGEKPACIDACPRQALSFGARADVLALARQKIRDHPDRYVDHVYGEHEVGGTSWMYVSPRPFEQVGFVKLGTAVPPALTESIQHGVFKYGIPPLLLYGTLGAAMFLTRTRAVARDQHAAAGRNPHQPHNPAPSHPHATAPEALHYEAHCSHEEEPQPVHRTLFTPGVAALLGLLIIGLGCGLYRFVAGLAASTNLTQQYPWGLWIAVDVASGVALAAGGFTTAFLAHVLHREHYHAIVRPALLTAMLGYTFVVIGLQADLGRYYNVWHPLFMWQGNSVLFEVGMCVMAYLTVLYLEFAPIVCERLMREEQRWPRVARLARSLHARLERIMFVLILAGCVLSCLHQSSLGTLMVITPSKLHPLWWTPISPLLFLLSAIAVGYPMVIWESLVAGWSLRLKPELSVLSPLARFVPITLGVYLTAKIGDMLWRGTWLYLWDGSTQSIAWLVEVLGGVVAPMLMLLSPGLRRSPRALFIAASLVVFGVVFNRVNVFLIGYRPPFAEKAYIPSLAEFGLTIGLFAGLMLAYRVIVTYLPVISQPKARVAA